MRASRSSSRLVISIPFKKIWPEVTVSRPASSPSSVLFPLPETPLMARNCPRGTEKVILRRISMRLGGFSIVLQRFRTSITGNSPELHCMALLETWDVGDQFLLLQAD